MTTTTENYKLISSAPTLSDLENHATATRTSFAEVIRAEAKRRYKAIDAKGQVWLCMNPNLASLELEDGKPAVVRFKPQLVGTIPKTSIRKPEQKKLWK